jgi:HAD superfamily hydrolase (TIGR01549 family)
MLSNPIETILFDLDGTLRHSVPSADDLQFSIAYELGAVDDPDHQVLGTRWTHYYWAQSAELIEDVERFGIHNGDLTSEFWFNYEYRYLRSLNVSETLAGELALRIARRMEEEYQPHNHVYPCVHETLEALKRAGFTLGLVSNRSNPCQEECLELGLLEYFKFAYVAAEVDAWKPNPRIFDRALELADSSPVRTIYVGDNYYADILGAWKAGLQPVLLDEKGVFPDAECVVIARVGDLVGLVRKE